MKCISFNAKTINRELEIIPLSDVHIGDENFNLQLFNDTINYILEKENRYCILNGDIINNATRTSVSDVYNEELTPTAQIIYAAKLLKPLANRIISVCTGNHELRSAKDDGIDLTLWLCNELGIQDRYDPNGCVDFIITDLMRRKNTTRGDGRNVATLYHTHGSGGGKRVGAKANALEDAGSYLDVDIVVKSHTHLPMAFKQDAYKVNVNTKNISKYTKLFVNTNAFLRFGGYGERMGFKPSSMEVPRIILRFTNNHKGRDLEMRAVI